jgi:peptide deformylase
MIIDKLVQIGDEQLKKKLLQVANLKDLELVELVRDLIDTLYKHELVGIASNQIGGRYRVFVTEVRRTKFRNSVKVDKVRVYINPMLVYESNEKEEVFEGCGSVAYSKLFAPVLRSKVIKVKAQDITGEEFTLEADGLLARVIQHEIDHLNNIEFLEKVTDWSRALSSEEYRKYSQN